MRRMINRMQTTRKHNPHQRRARILSRTNFEPFVLMAIIVAVIYLLLFVV